MGAVLIFSGFTTQVSPFSPRYVIWHDHKSWSLLSTCIILSSKQFAEGCSITQSKQNGTMQYLRSACLCNTTRILPMNATHIASTDIIYINDSVFLSLCQELAWEVCEKEREVWWWSQCWQVLQFVVWAWWRKKAIGWLWLGWARLWSLCWSLCKELAWEVCEKERERRAAMK